MAGKRGKCSSECHASWGSKLRGLEERGPDLLRDAEGCGDPGGEGNRPAPPPETERLADWRNWKKNISHEDMDEVLRSAPWATKVGSHKAWNTTVLWHLRDADKPPEEKVIQQMFWSKEKTGWKFHEGILPSHGTPEDVVVAIDADSIEVLAAQEEDQGVLKKGLRKRIQRSMRDLTVTEVYSEPRVAKTAERFGMKAGTSFDLKTGFDLSTRTGRKRCWKQILLEDADLILVCPPCGPFSNLQNFNYDKMPIERAMVMLGDGLEHLEFSMQVYEWQVRRGRKAVFEHPAGSRAWNENCVQRVLSLPDVVRVRGDQCQFGLKVSETGEPSKKPTDFMVNGDNMARRLAMRCQGGHTHTPSS